MKKRSERRKHCALAVVRRSQKFSPRRRPLSRGAQDGQNLISWRWSLPSRSPTDPVWWSSMHAISSYRGNRATNKHKRTGPITIHCAANLSARCNRLCGKPRNMPPPLYAASCSPAPAHTHLTPAAPSAPWPMNIHDCQAAVGSGRWRRNLNSRWHWPLTFWPWSGVRVTYNVGYLCANFGLL